MSLTSPAEVKAVISDELNTLQRELLALSSEQVREDLIELELEDIWEPVHRWESDETLFLEQMSLAEFRSTQRVVIDALTELDKGRGHPRIHRYLDKVNMFVKKRHKFDATAAAKRRKSVAFDRRVSRIASISSQISMEDAISGASFTMHSPSSTHTAMAGGKVEAADLPDRIRRIQQLTGLEFTFVPSGQYEIGAATDEGGDANEENGGFIEDAEEQQCSRMNADLSPRAWKKDVNGDRVGRTPSTYYTLPYGMYVSTTRLKVRHWHRAARCPLDFPDVADNPLFDDTMLSLMCSDFTCTDPDSNKGAYRKMPRRQLLEASDPEASIIEADIELPFFIAQRAAAVFGCSVPSWQQWECAVRGPEGHRYPWGNDAPDDDTIYLSRDGVFESFGQYEGTESVDFDVACLDSVVPEWNAADYDLGMCKNVHHKRDGGDAPTTHILRTLIGLGPKYVNGIDLSSCVWPYGPHRRTAAFRLCYVVPDDLNVPTITRQSRTSAQYPTAGPQLRDALISDVLGKDEVHLFRSLGPGEIETVRSNNKNSTNLRVLVADIAYPRLGISVTMTAQPDNDGGRIVSAVHFHRGLELLPPSRVDYNAYEGPLPSAFSRVLLSSGDAYKNVDNAIFWNDLGTKEAIEYKTRHDKAKTLVEMFSTDSSCVCEVVNEGGVDKADFGRRCFITFDIAGKPISVSVACMAMSI